MRNKRRYFFIGGALLVIMFTSVFLYTLFGGDLKNIGTSSNREVSVGAPEEMPSVDKGESEGAPGIIVTDSSLSLEKIIGTYNMSFETLNFPKVILDVSALVTRYEGYVESSNIYNNTSQDGKIYKSATYTLRIPKDKVAAFNNEFKNVASLITDSSSLQNVTKYYKDTQSRLSTLETQLKRLNELYTKAEEIADIITIESKINEIIYQIENIKGELQYLDERIDYSTVSATIQEVAKLTSGESIQANLGERIQKALKDSAEFFQEAMVNFLILLIFVIPFIIVFGFLLFLVLKIFGRKKAKVEPPRNTGRPIAGEDKDKIE